jgi:hypothetical protein
MTEAVGMGITMRRERFGRVTFLPTAGPAPGPFDANDCTVPRANFIGISIT